MDSASIQFLLFGFVAALASNLSRSPMWRSIVLFIASLTFLVFLSRNPLTFAPLALFLLMGHLCLVLLERRWLKTSTWCVLAIIFAYAWLKKYTFLPEGILLHTYYITLGLSYIFFRVLHLLIETGDSDNKPRISLGSYLLYTINFTTFVSGPIQHYDDFARDQFAPEPIALGARVIGVQLERVVRGFFKVNVMAMLLHSVQNEALAQLAQPQPLLMKLFAAFKLAVAYPFFLYTNFSGYIDIVIALARLMRVRLPENFDRPFSASSFIDFWNRWHITLSTWLKTYVYNPLLMASMRRVSSVTWHPLLGVLSFFVTFFLVGLWHGRTSEFLFFGVLQGGGVAINKLWQLGLTRGLGRKGYKAVAANAIYIAFGRGLTFSWFAFTLFWFWGTWKQLGLIFHALGLVQAIFVALTTWLCATVLLALWESTREGLLSLKMAGKALLTHRYARVAYASALGAIAIAVTMLMNRPAPDLVYKSF